MADWPDALLQAEEYKQAPFKRGGVDRRSQGGVNERKRRGSRVYE